jgi:hypothetical protein
MALPQQRTEVSGVKTLTREHLTTIREHVTTIREHVTLPKRRATTRRQLRTAATSEAPGRG